MSDRRILVLNGPNLNILGTREPHLYGSTTLAEIEARLVEKAATCSVPLEIEMFQSNHEGALIDKIQEAGPSVSAIVINPGALTHYSIALRDALSAFGKPVVEVHLTNIHAREEFRRHSVIASIVAGQIAGLGPLGYEIAVEYLVQNVINTQESAH
jgi:3-dehydroquinate dehydratase II